MSICPSYLSILPTSCYFPPVYLIVSNLYSVWCHPLKCGWPTRDHTFKENCLSLSQQPSTIRISSVRGESWAPATLLDRWLTLSSAGNRGNYEFMGFTGVVSGLVKLRTLFCSGSPWTLALPQFYPSAEPVLGPELGLGGAVDVAFVSEHACTF